MTIAIQTHQLRKTYRDGAREVSVLKGVDLDVEEGEFVGIVGPSGSGKSTLLHLLGGLDRADSGSVEVGGRALERMCGAELAAFRGATVGFVFQFYELLPDFTALENVMMPGWIAGEAAAKVRRRATELLDEVGLSGRREHFPSQLSGGERQRVAICRALLLDPPLLLADEPTGNLDPDHGEQIVELLERLRAARRTTTVLVTHNPVVARRCGRILQLVQGVLEPVTEGAWN